MAEFVAEEMSDEDEKWKPAASDFTLMHELVAECRDMIGEACALLADLPVAVEKRHTPPDLFPRPLTELDKAVKAVKVRREEEYDAGILAFADEAKARWRRQQAELAAETSEAMGG